jgi:sterol desaturase/sphingolipid hydroxylase (fatty acid hydroxylase superfamily)
VHHGSNPSYIDRNHGGTLIIWDKLFGTFEPENPADPVRIAFHEWVDLFRDAWRAPGWANKLRYVFGNPGWRHEPAPGPTFGARQPT